MCAIGIALTLLCLLRITDNMRRLMAGSIEQAVNKTLEGSALIGVGIGIVLTVAVHKNNVIAASRPGTGFNRRTITLRVGVGHNANTRLLTDLHRPVG